MGSKLHAPLAEKHSLTCQSSSASGLSPESASMGFRAQGVWLFRWAWCWASGSLCDCTCLRAWGWRWSQSQAVSLCACRFGVFLSVLCCVLWMYCWTCIPRCLASVSLHLCLNMTAGSHAYVRLLDLPYYQPSFAAMPQNFCIPHGTCLRSLLLCFVFWVGLVSAPPCQPTQLDVPEWSVPQST